MDRVITVGGIPIHAFTSMEELVSALIAPEGRVRPAFAVAVNAEKVIRARTDLELRTVLVSEALCYADGVSVVRTMRNKGAKVVRTPGADLWLALMRRAAKQSIPVYILGASREVNDSTVARLTAEMGVNVVGHHDGFFNDPEEIVANIRGSGAQIITVAMGSPKQERLIRQARLSVPGALYMGVGGTYDVFVGRVRRAPRLFQVLGLEWLFRLLLQPSRAFRQRALLIYARDHLLKRL